MSFAKPLILSIALLGAGIPSAFAETKTAIFAGGCFWCVESDFEHVKGVSDVISGYTGGETDNPTYKNHVKDNHLEAVQITYDSEVVSYDQLLDTFWRTVDPTDAGGQFCDRGNSYTTAIFAVDEMQRELAESSKLNIDESGKLSNKIATPIRDAATFYPAEDYHQNYYKKNPTRYKYYKWACKRSQTVEALWGEEAYLNVEDH